MADSIYNKNLHSIYNKNKSNHSLLRPYFVLSTVLRILCTLCLNNNPITLNYNNAHRTDEDTEMMRG